MSDFLSNFGKDNYDKMVADEENKKEKNQEKIIEDNDIPVFTEKNTETLNFLDIQETSEIKEEQTPRKSNHVAEILEKDLSYAKNQKRKFAIIIAVVCLLCSALGGGFYLLNRVTVPNFVDKDISEAKTWALKNRIELDVTEEFDVKAEAQKVIEQGKEANKTILKGSLMTIKVSKGADPDEQLKLPDFSKMKTSAIEQWKTDNAAENLKIVKEFHDTEENGKFLKMEFKDTKVTADSYLRKDVLTVYVSKGKEVFEKNIVVPDFKEKQKAEVEAWAKTNDVTIKFNEVASTTVPVDAVVSQSIASGEKIAKKDEIGVDISVGKTIYVPWYGNYTMNQAMTVEPSLQLQVIQEYNMNVAYGDMIWQSVEAGTYLTMKDDLNVKAYYSLGKPYIGNLSMMTEDQLPAYFYDFKEKGASITYTIHYIDGGEKGTISHASKSSQYVSLNEHVDIYVYR